MDQSMTNLWRFITLLLVQIIGLGVAHFALINLKKSTNLDSLPCKKRFFLGDKRSEYIANTLIITIFITMLIILMGIFSLKFKDWPSFLNDYGIAIVFFVDWFIIGYFILLTGGVSLSIY